MSNNFDWEEVTRKRINLLKEIEGNLCDGDVILFIRTEVARILGMLYSYIEDDDKDLEDVINDIKKMYKPITTFEPVQLDLDFDVISALKEMANKSNCTIDFVVEQILKKLVGNNGEL